MPKKNRVSGNRGSKKGTGKKKKEKETTVIFSAPSTGRTITTLIPDFVEALAVVSAATLDAEQMMGVMMPDDDAVRGSIVLQHLTQWFTENYVKLTPKQVKKGTKYVRRLREKYDIESMPEGNKLISHITLLWVAPTAIDRAHLMAHILNITGLAEAVGDEALQEALNG